MENTPRIETERLILRRFTPDDLDDMFLILSDTEANTFLPWFPAKTPEDAMRHMRKHFLAHYEKPSAYRYAVCLKTDDRPIGYAGVNDDDSHDLGYGFRHEFWRKGIATEACLAIARRMEASGMPYITATHDKNNPASGAVMRKIGMTYRYSYDELWQPKNFWVTFCMYQRNFDGAERTYTRYLTDNAGNRRKHEEE